MNDFDGEIEARRDRFWRRTEDLKVESVADAEKFIEEVGFCAALTDARTALPSLYIAVCGRRDAHKPKNVQKDYEMDLAWTLKDEIIARSRVYYGKVTKSQTLFIAPRLISDFNALYGVAKKDETTKLSANARVILKTLRREWESSSADLREESGISDRQTLTKSLDELQNRMKVVPSQVFYQPTFTYVWTTAESRFPKELAAKCSQETALKNICRAYLQTAGRAEVRQLAKLLNLKPLEINLGFLQLVEDGAAFIEDQGVYRLASDLSDYRI